MFHNAGQTSLTRLLAALLAAVLFASHCSAGEPVPVIGDALFLGYDPGGDAGENISGATCFSDHECILVADEMLALQKISLVPAGVMPTYQAGPTYGLFFSDYCTDISKKKACDEVDLEAIARNGRGVLVTGSMGNKRKSGKRTKDRWFLAQFVLNENGKPRQGSLQVQSRRSLLKELFRKHPSLQPYLEKPLQCGGLNIEGLATAGDQIFFGLRSPSGRDEGQAYVVQSPDSILTAATKQKVEPTRLHVLTFKDVDGKPLRDVGIRSLETLGNRLLIVTADAGVSKPNTKKQREDMVARCASVPNGKNLANIAGGEPLVPRLWIWDPAKGDDPSEIAHLDGLYSDEKLEGIAVLGNPLPQADMIDLLLVIDGQKDVPPLALLRGVPVPP